MADGPGGKRIPTNRRCGVVRVVVERLSDGIDLQHCEVECLEATTKTESNRLLVQKYADVVRTYANFRVGP